MNFFLWHKKVVHIEPKVKFNLKFVAMKMFNWVIVLVVSTGFFLLSGCCMSSGDASESGLENAIGEIQGNYVSDSVPCLVQVDQIDKEDLSIEEANALKFMREEEKMARDVYLTLYDKWVLMPFKNISKSEQVHMDAILTLLKRYGLEDPAEGKDVGVFENAELQELYNQLVANGMKSVVDALKAGALIEEVDIRDIQKILDEKVDNQDIKIVLGNLLRGSGHHLNAFIWNLSRRGVNYVPEVLDQSVYDSILNKNNKGVD